MTDQTPARQLKNLRDAHRRMRSVLIANADRLDIPFTNAPEKTPWETFAKPAMRELDQAVKDIAKLIGELERQHLAAEAALERGLHLADVIAAGAPWTANHDNLADRIRDALKTPDPS